MKKRLQLGIYISNRKQYGAKTEKEGKVKEQTIRKCIVRGGNGDG